MLTLVKCAYINQEEMRMHKFEQSFLSQNKFQLHVWNFYQLFISLYIFAFWRQYFFLSGCGVEPSEMIVTLPSYYTPTLYEEGPDDKGCWFYSGNSTVPVSNVSESLGSMSPYQCVLYGSQNNTWYYH